MDGDKENRESNLFLVRLWMDEGPNDGTAEKHSWHGKVQHVITGKAGSFSSQDSMMQLLASMSSSPRPESTKSRGQSGSSDSVGPDAPHLSS